MAKQKGSTKSRNLADSVYVIFHYIQTIPPLFGYERTHRVIDDSAMNMIKTLTKSLMDKSKLLGGIGSAEMQIETEKWVRNIGKRDYRTNIPPSMTEYDVRTYIKDVVEEIKSRRG